MFVAKNIYFKNKEDCRKNETFNHITCFIYGFLTK